MKTSRSKGARISAAADPVRYAAALTFGLIIALAFMLATTFSAAANPDRWRAEGWSSTDFEKTSIDFSEILDGGPPRDGIPSIDDPVFKSAEEAADAPLPIGPMEPVVSLEINGDARAYPVRVLMWHEIVNDTVGGVPVTVTYCPLCNTALAFERQFDGVTHDFGTTGKLRNSDLVMYDRQTDSWWQQFTGEAIVGEKLGTVLKGVPVRMEAFAKFRERVPDGKVQVPDTRSSRFYGSNPYVNYDQAARPFLFRGDLPTDIEPMARVVMFEGDQGAKAVSLTHLRDVGKLEVDGVVLAWEAGQNSALHTSKISDGRDVGNVTVQRKSGDDLNDIVHHVTFAFAYRAFVPDGVILQ